MGGMEHPVVLFDGVCNLCNRSVQYIIRHDPKGRFHFASLQSDAGRGLQERYGFDPGAVNTIILLERGKAYTRSDAVLRIARLLRGPVRFWWTARLLPRPVRDAVYDWIGRNRYRWFGRREECMVPSPSVRSRFLDATEAESSSVLG
jgi:predicted DCC family thiol-disulfide oxidoreductase YuxK